MQISGTSVQTEALRASGNYMIPVSCTAGWGTEDKIKTTLNRLPLVFLVVLFRRTRNEGFSALQQLGMLLWSPPSPTMPHVLASRERQRFLWLLALPLPSQIWWTPECWAQSWGRCLAPSPRSSESPHLQPHRGSLEQGWPRPLPRSGWA